jgi:hypothetical protein
MGDLRQYTFSIGLCKEFIDEEGSDLQEKRGRNSVRGDSQRAHCAVAYARGFAARIVLLNTYARLRHK